MTRTVVILTGLSLAGSIVGDELKPLGDEVVRRIAPKLMEKVDATADLPAKVTADNDHAKALVNEEAPSGLMIIPAKELKDDRNNPELAKGKGVPVGVFFLYNLLPEGAADKNKLFSLSYTNDDGEQHDVRFGVLTIHKVEGHFQLELWGSAEEPVAKTRLGNEEGDGKGPLAIEVTGKEVKLIWLGKYGASFNLKDVKF